MYAPETAHLQRGLSGMCTRSRGPSPLSSTEEILARSQEGITSSCQPFQHEQFSQPDVCNRVGHPVGQTALSSRRGECQVRGLPRLYTAVYPSLRCKTRRMCLFASVASGSPVY